MSKLPSMLFRTKGARRLTLIVLFVFVLSLLLPQLLIKPTVYADDIRTLNGQALTANERKWISWIAENVTPNLGGSPEENAVMAAHGTWWSLREGVLDLNNPIGYNNCGTGSGNTYIGFTATCPSGYAWQVGIAAVQVPNPSASEVISKSRQLNSGKTLRDIIGNVSKLAGYSEGSSEYNTAVSSSGDRQKSLLLRDGPTGFWFVDREVTGECLIATPRSWCLGNSWSSSPAVINKIIKELTDYYKNNAGQSSQSSPGDTFDCDLHNIYNDTVWYDPCSGQGSTSCDTEAVGETLPDKIPEPHRTIFTKAAAKFHTNVQLLAAIFLSEHANTWLPIDSPDWSNSPVAFGPFQFTKETWEEYGIDGNNDGKKDINNFYDAAYGAANNLRAYNARPGSSLGELNHPLRTNTLLQIAASYNAGPGNVQMYGPNMTLEELHHRNEETWRYVRNVYALISSGFTQGVPEWPLHGSGGGSGDAGSSDCSGAVAGDAVKTAINYAWPDQYSPPHCVQKPEYKRAINKASGEGQYTGAWCGWPGGDSSVKGIDCGAFVTRVMIDSGADSGYNYGGKEADGAGPTSTQQRYLEEQVTKGKYIRIGALDSPNNLKPGDIAVNSGHTFIYVGRQPGFHGDSASASQGERSPNASTAYFSNDEGPFTWYRLKGS